MIALCVVASSINLLVLKFLTMNTMDEKENAQQEARKQLSSVFLQVTNEQSRPASVAPLESPKQATKEIIPRAKYSQTSDYSVWESSSNSCGGDNSLGYPVNRQKRRYTRHEGNIPKYHRNFSTKQPIIGSHQDSNV